MRLQAAIIPQYTLWLKGRNRGSSPECVCSARVALEWYTNISCRLDNLKYNVVTTRPSPSTGLML